MNYFQLFDRLVVPLGNQLFCQIYHRLQGQRLDQLESQLWSHDYGELGLRLDMILRTKEEL